MSDRRILLVEDDAAILDAVKEVLENAGYTVETARNGLDALQILRSEKSLPSLILLDLMMPLMNGYEFRKVQESDAAIASIPVLIMTADGQIEAKKHKVNAKGFVKKPIEIDSFLAEVKRYCL